MDVWTIVEARPGKSVDVYHGLPEGWIPTGRRIMSRIAALSAYEAVKDWLGLHIPPVRYQITAVSDPMDVSTETVSMYYQIVQFTITERKESDNA